MTRAQTALACVIANAQRSSDVKVRAALACHLDASQRELDRRNAEGEDVSHLHVHTCGAIVPAATRCFFCEVTP